MVAGDGVGRTLTSTFKPVANWTEPNTSVRGELNALDWF